MQEIRRNRARRIAALPAAALLLLANAPSFAAADSPWATAPAAPREAALHALNRLGFGPRPGDVERVIEMGLSRYVDQQLHPERIPDAGVERRLAEFPTLAMTTADLMETYEKPLREARRERKQELDREGGAGRDGTAAQAELEKLRQRIPPDRRPRRILEELSASRIVRAAESQRQLNEVLVDFWMNHFNVYANKGPDRILVASYERDVVRPRIWGKFQDLLMATARSPAMLFYLDNARSVADEAHRPALSGWRAGLFGRGRVRDADLQRIAKAGANAPTGLNENYARELLELHTLGVDGGYTEKDVTELARLLTGWSIDRRRDGGFVFRAALHDVGRKTVLGLDFPPGGGIEEGETMIRLLARHPSTARRIAWKLCQRLVADDPPKTLVDHVAQRFLSTGGDLRETLSAVVTSPEFQDPRYYRAKVKSPFEYAVSAVRAVGGSTDGRALAREIAQMGEPLYLCQPPTGYSEEARSWISSGALVARLNFALALAAGGLPGTGTDIPGLLSAEVERDHSGTVDALARALVGGDLSPETRATIEQRIAQGGSSAQLIAGLILGSPEFQRQ